MDHWPPEPHTKCNDFGFSFKKTLYFFAVPVTLVTSTTTTEAPMIESESSSSTAIKLATSDADEETHGCHIDGDYYEDGMQVSLCY